MYLFQLETFVLITAQNIIVPIYKYRSNRVFVFLYAVIVLHVVRLSIKYINAIRTSDTNRNLSENIDN